jgi:CHAT domain-containing protein/tetratricopeptide (TPR) repeat protein
MDVSRHSSARTCFWPVRLWVSLTLVAILPGAAAVSLPVASPESPPPAGAGARPQETEGGVALGPHDSVDGELSGADPRRYRILLDSGTYLGMVLEKGGLDVAVQVSGPSGEPLVQVDSRRRGPTPVSLVAGTSGLHTIALEARQPAPGEVRFSLRVEDLRPAVPMDQTRIAAERSFGEAEALAAEWTPSSRLEALDRYEEALDQWRACGNEEGEVDALNAIGSLRLSSGLPEPALESFRRAARLSRELGDGLREAESVVNVAAAHRHLGDNDDALAQVTAGLGLCRDQSCTWQQPQALFTLGRVRYSRGEMREALRAFGEALALWEEIDDLRGQAEALLYTGFAHSVLGHDDDAMKCHERALALWRHVGDRKGKASALRALGYIHSARGEKQKALDRYFEARELLRPTGDRAALAVVLNGLGQAYYDLDQKPTALHYYQEALRLNRAAQFPRGEAISLVEIGRCKSAMGDHNEALHYYQEALSAYRDLGDARMEAAVLGDVGNVHQQSGDLTTALRYYDTALPLKRAAGDLREEALTLNDIGRVHHLLGNTGAALDHLQQALAITRTAAFGFGQSLTLFNLARLERDMGRLDAAASHMDASLETIESLRRQVASHELKASYFASVHEYYELYIDILMQAHGRRPTGGLEARALQASESARARALMDSLGEAATNIREGVDPGLLEEERSLRQQLNAGAERQMALAGSPDSSEFQAATRQLRVLSTEYDQVQGRIRSQSPRYAALTQPQPLTMEEIQDALLDEETLLLEYALGSERSYLWAVEKTTSASYELPGRDEIESVARRVYKLLTAREPVPGETAKQHHKRVRKADVEYWSEAAELSDIVLRPVADRLGTKRLVVVAEGALLFVPFAALPTPNPTRSGKEGPAEHLRGHDGPTPLGVQHEIVRLPSASTLAVLRREISDRVPGRQSVAVLADPVFALKDPRVREERTGRPGPGDRAPAPSTEPPRSDLRRTLRDMGLLRDGFGVPRLLATRQEARAIVGLAPPGTAMTALGFEASRALATGPALAQYRIVHFATHGLLNSEHPELSGVVLSLVDEQGRPEDGFLRLHDIYNLDLPVELVVLSACRTGLGKEIRGEGLVGIVRGFMYAGAARVVASSWKVDDEATAELMTRFYRHMLEDRLPEVSALRAAQLEMWQQKRWRAPFYWAAFELQGEWR